MGRRALLTGATGYIGSEVAAHLARWGWEVVGTYRSEAPPAISGVSAWRHLDLTDSAAAMRDVCRDVDAVLHLGAVRGERGLDPTWIAAVNTRGTLNLADAAAGEGVSEFVFFSTVGVHGFADQVSEDTPFAWDDSAYHTSKANAELGLRERAERFARLLVLRPCVVYGERRTDGYVFNLTRLIRTGLFVKLGFRSPRLEMVYIDNLVEGIRVALEHGRHGQAYIITDRKALPVHRICDLIAVAVGARILPGRIPAIAARSGAVVAEKALRALGREPFVTPHKLKLFLDPQTYVTDRMAGLGYSPTVTPEEALPLVARAVAGLD